MMTFKMSYLTCIKNQLRALHPHLPLPPDDAVALSQQLSNRLQHQIAQHGALPFQHVMQQLLYAPGMGYYSAGLAKLGAAGDFVTAPEMSPLFSQTLAHSLVTVLSQRQQNVLELGAGRGLMAADMLRYWQQQHCLPEHYFILDVSADLRAVQQQTLRERVPDCIDRVRWLDTWPSEFDGVVIGNEVLDAMPFTLFEIDHGAIVERAVTLADNDTFAWTNIDASAALQQWFAQLPEDIRAALQDGYQGEVLLSLPQWMQALSASMKQGHVLLIDYGFPQHELYLAERSQGTLMCHYRHTAHPDPLTLIGLQDITCHVDFSAVAETAFNAGFAIDGYTSQGGFLQEVGILTLARSDDVATQFRHAQQLKRLLLPSEMGELFKVIALSKNASAAISGFALNDRRHRL